MVGTDRGGKVRRVGTEPSPGVNDKESRSTREGSTGGTNSRGDLIWWGEYRWFSLDYGLS